MTHVLLLLSIIVHSSYSFRILYPISSKKTLLTSNQHYGADCRYCNSHFNPKRINPKKRLRLQSNVLDQIHPSVYQQLSRLKSTSLHYSENHEYDAIFIPTNHTQCNTNTTIISSPTTTLKNNKSYPTKVTTTSESQSFNLKSNYQPKVQQLDLTLLLIDNYDSYTYNLYSYLSTICTKPPIVVSNDAYSSWNDVCQAFSSNHSNGSSRSDDDGWRKQHPFDGIIISPGPGTPIRPKDIGICLEAIEQNPNLPILGVCLGHQALGHFYNASVILSPSGPVHGFTSQVWFDQTPPSSSISQLPRCNLFDGIPQLFDVVRYHSLVVQFPSSSQNDTLSIEPIAWCHGKAYTSQHSNDMNNSNIDDIIESNKIDHEHDICMALQHKTNPHYGVQFHPESIGTGQLGYQLLENFCSFCSEWRNYQMKRLRRNTALNIASANIDNNRYIKTANNNNNPTIPSKITVEINAITEENSNNFTKESNFIQKYKVYVHKVTEGNLPLPQQVFDTFYASKQHSFWFDSSTAKANTYNNTATTTTTIFQNSLLNDQQSCPIVSNSRFSIMGTNDGKYSKIIEYYGKDHHISRQGLYITENNQNNSNCNHDRIDEYSTLKLQDKDIITYLREEMTNSAFVNATHILEFNNESETDFFSETCLSSSEDYHDIPFEYRGGYVGYFGYEVRHDTRRSMCQHEVCSAVPDESSSSTRLPSEDKSNPHVPTAAFLFADRSLVYDHWTGVWYVVGVELNNACAVEESDYLSNHDSTISWMRQMSNKLKTIMIMTKSEETESTTSSPNIQEQQPQQNTLEFQLARSKNQYINDIAICLDKIKNGESYELCLTNQLKTNVSFPTSEITPIISMTNESHAASLRQSPYGLYKILRRKNPAPFAAFFNLGNRSSSSLDSDNCKNKIGVGSVSICCSSPERFLSVKRMTKSDANNMLSTMPRKNLTSLPASPISTTDETSTYNNLFMVESKPIKGTITRNIGTTISDMEQDSQLAESLRTSVKNRSENLMIVDLLRNDLSRICQPGSVHVPKLMQIESFQTVHQLVSTIRGIVDGATTTTKNNVSNHHQSNCVDVLAACFPGGSMTGAPKLRSTDILHEIEEGNSRGPYSGCIGYFSLNGSMDMNIIIRTAVVTPADLSVSSSESLCSSSNGGSSRSWDVTIGAGGAITFLSDFEEEYEEMMLKAKAVKSAVQDWSQF